IDFFRLKSDLLSVDVVVRVVISGSVGISGRNRVHNVGGSVRGRRGVVVLLLRARVRVGNVVRGGRGIVVGLLLLLVVRVRRGVVECLLGVRVGVVIVGRGVGGCSSLGDRESVVVRVGIVVVVLCLGDGEKGKEKAE
ncbi:hypothetical protein PFISCL1PPCAC_1337, partial [Pristionchus fissidentatus]